jgi:hypothetical protein
MKCTIEIVRFGAGTEVEVLVRSVIYVINPRWAKAKAQALLDAWKPRGANGAVILNHNLEQVYRWRED